jgi:hypothetical protein
MLTGFLIGLATGFPLGAVALFLWAVVDCTRTKLKLVSRAKTLRMLTR